MDHNEVWNEFEIPYSNPDQVYPPSYPEFANHVKLIYSDLINKLR